MGTLCDEHNFHYSVFYFGVLGLCCTVGDVLKCKLGKKAIRVILFVVSSKSLVYNSLRSFSLKKFFCSLKLCGYNTLRRCANDLYLVQSKDPLP